MVPLSQNVIDLLIPDFDGVGHICKKNIWISEMQLQEIYILWNCTKIAGFHIIVHKLKYFTFLLFKKITTRSGLVPNKLYM